ncbi:MAG: FAD-containing oxidoreductase [Acidobacteria bacterium]|nr:MAG: FAD-containing oxidoreductase [Acidobacteriota bacterium]
MSHSHDAIIIGTGQAGPPLARRLSSAGMSVAIVERHLFGGTCVNTGCIPTKAMVASAYIAHASRRARDFGVTIDGDVRVDMKNVKVRKDRIAERSRAGVERMLRGLPRCEVNTGHARFRSAREVAVGEHNLSADRIFINVGGRPCLPPMPGLDQVPFLTNSSMMNLDTVPRHLLVVGGGYIGLEFGQMFRRFGSEVTIIEMASRLVQREDTDISSAVQDVLINEGITLRLNARCLRVSGDAGSIIAHVDCEEGSPSIEGSHLLLAVGRQPNTDDLGLDAAGVSRDDRGYIVVNDQLETNVPGIWALGDCNGRGAFTHTAYNDFEIVASNLLEGTARRISDRISAYALFIDPPLGRVGLTETEAEAQGRSILVARRPMKHVGRAIEKGETNGLMKIVVDAQFQQILGAAVFGTGGDEVIHCVLDTMYAKAPYPVLRRAMHIHPTVSELIPTLLEGLAPPAR